MGNKFMNKMWNLLGVDDGEYDEYGELDTPVISDDRDFVAPVNNKKSKIIGMPNTNQSQVQVIISQPTSYEQAKEICEHLKNKKSIILNVEYVNREVAYKIIDFMSGAVCALDGGIQKISNSIFLIVPYNYEIINEATKEEIKNKLSVSWIK